MKIRRIIAVTVTLALGASTVALSQGGSAAAESQSAANPSLSIKNPGRGQTKIRGGDILAFSGTAAEGAQLGRGRLLTITPQGEIDHAYTLSTLSLQDGVFSGQTTYPGPNSAAAHNGEAVLEVTMLYQGEQQVIRSNGLRIDLVRPYILSTSLVAPDTIKVQFSEPVSMNEPLPDSDLVADWRVDDQIPLEVTMVPGDRSVRLLKVKDGSGAYDQDATPTVKLLEFLVGTASIPKHWYQDAALWILEAEMNRTTVARDRIAPAAPMLASIAGEANDGVEEIVSNQRKPEFEIRGLRPGHVGQVYLESNKKDGFQPDGDALIGEAVAGEDGKAIIAPEDGLDDDSYKVYGVARDRAKCQPSEPASAECPNYSAPAPGFYTLDTVAPVALFAQTTLRQGSVDDAIIQVRFSEDISPQNGDPAEWSVGGTPPESVTGIGSERVLDIAAIAPSGTPVTWTSPAQGGYADEAGNALLPFQLAASDGIPPLVFLDPDLAGTTALYRRNGNCAAPEGRVCFVLTGSVERATHLLVHGAPDEQERVTLANGDVFTGRFTIEVNLLPNERNDNVQIEPIRLDLSQPEPTEVRGPMARVRPIVHDATPPVVTVGAMGRGLNGGGVGYKAADQATISWTASDKNLVAGPIRIDLSTDGGSTWENIADGKANSSGNAGSYGWSVPALNTEKAMIKIVATDQVGFKTAATSNEFVIDSKLPYFTPKTLLDEAGNPTRVLLTFSEPVVFNTDPGSQWNQWHIKEPGKPAVPASSSTPVATTQGPNGLTMITKLMLTTGFVDGTPEPVQQHLDRNGTPTIEYVVPEGGQGVADQFRDRANNLLASNTGKALDGIAPLAPKNLSARDLVREKSEPVRGEAEPDQRLDVMVRRLSPGATFSDTVTVKSAGTGPLSTTSGLFAVQVGLAPNKVNSYEVWVQDPAGNESPVVDLGIENDRTRPRVKVLKPRTWSKRGKRYLKLRWKSVERNKDSVDILFRLRGKDTSERLRRLVRNTPDDGSYKWRVPRKFWGKQFKVAIVAKDQVGNKGSRGYRWFRL